MNDTSNGASRSSEDYLRAVYQLSKTELAVRSVDVARVLGVSKPSVHRGLANLAEQGYVVLKSYSPVVLTQKGKIAGKKLQDRYDASYRFLTNVLAVDEDRAAKEAHAMEHAISIDTARRLSDYLAHA